ncbi:hypothetical protein OpiT1DRAFT_03101 [Opitutaceae bacterium TAV1]|nr:hypothetical protein OpiT1DRAFT_03101 [Opitutaceae bacterium TAV1]
MKTPTLRPLAGIAGTLMILASINPVFADYAEAVLASKPAYYLQFPAVGKSLADNTAPTDSKGAAQIYATRWPVTQFTTGPRPANGFPGFPDTNLAARITGVTAKLSGIYSTKDLTTALNGSLGITAELWLYPTALPTDAQNHGLLFIPQKNGAPALALSLTPTGIRMTGRSAEGEAAQGAATWEHELALGKWQHLAAVWDYRQKTMRLFLNGEPIGEPVSATTWTSQIFDFEGRFLSLIGAENINNDDTACKGRIDEFALYTRALSAADIAAHFAAAKTAPTQANKN